MRPLLLLWALTICGSLNATDYYVIYLGGQSNMDGYGYTKDLPASFRDGFNDVYIFHGNPAPDNEGSADGKGLWTLLRPGHGVGFNSDGQQNHYSDRFGIELSLIQELKRLMPQARFALVKYSKGGTSIDSLAAEQFGCWEPDFQGTTGINQYDHFLATTRNALSQEDIDGDGEQDRLIPIGIIWMQGESDATVNEEVASRYYHNLKRLMDLIRAAYHADDLPVAVGKISDSWNDEQDGKVWDYGELVQYAQEKFVRSDDKAAIIRTTRYYKYSDPWHYDSEGYLDLGKQFAQALVQLMDSE